MSEKQLTEGTSVLGSSQQRVIVINAKEQPQEIKLRVAAYARVSTSSDDQVNSFEAQNKHYTDLIASKANWQMVDIYADCGLSGRTAEKRGDFQRLLSDCRKGKIDRILVKSISRFARNTKECLETVRELKLLGIGVYFEKESIDTAKMSGEMMTAMFASLAQAESQSISGNMRWSNRKRMASGTYLPSSMLYGYKLDGKNIEINSDEAAVVREIFQVYLQGMGKDAIAQDLNNRGIRTGQGKRWSYRAIDYLLGNERYVGDSLWQKTYATETFPPVKVKNKGELPQYYVQGTHPPIISKEVFDAVQELSAQRRDRFGKENSESVHPFSKKIVCGCCGRIYRKKINRGKEYWSCLTHERNSDACQAKPIPETEIQSAFQRLYYKLKHQAQPILSEIISNLQNVRRNQMLWSEDIVELNRKISDINSQNQMLTALNQQGLIDPDFFISQSNNLAEQLRATKQKKERLLNAEGDRSISQTKELIEILESGPDFPDTFDEELFGELVEQIIAENNEKLRFRLFNGLELAETIERTVR